MLGNEVKSIRLKKVNLQNSYIKIENNEIFVFNMFVEKYKFCNKFDYDDKKKKKLLLNKEKFYKSKKQYKLKD